MSGIRIRVYWVSRATGQRTLVTTRLRGRTWDWPCECARCMPKAVKR